jgi:Ser/Thr protein kinase RdoA (MazF antagonist)
MKNIYKKLVSFLESKKEEINDFRLLQKIETGYTSTVYLIAINKKNLAVKIYHQRYNNSDVCLREQKNLMEANKRIPKKVPKVHFFSRYNENEFNREIIVTEQITGNLLTEKIFDERTFMELIKVLKKLHEKKGDKILEVDEIKRIHYCRKTILNFLKEDETITNKKVVEHLDYLKNYLLKNKRLFEVQKSFIHGDLWWDNIIVDNDEVKMLDWLEAGNQDYCRDLAQLKVGILDEMFETKKSEEFFMKLLDNYQNTFLDKTIHERMRYHLPLMYLEESFYLPFKYFPWQIKYEEDKKKFKRRFVDYFKKSEKIFF